MVYPPNNVPQNPQDNQQQGNPVRDLIKDAAPKIALRLVLVALAVVALFVLVRDLAGFGGFMGLSIFNIIEGAGIDPRDQAGFKNFLFIALSAFAVWLLSKFFGKGGD